jgi:hypothetical protein
MSMERDLLHTRGLERHLAAYFLGTELDQRLPSVRELAREYHSSIGSISNAINELEELGAIQIERRGHLGSFICSRSLGVLWTIAEQGPMVIGFPLTSSLRFSGLATGLKKLLSEAGIEAYLIFIRGSQTRIQALREGRCHAVAMSVFAADKLCTGEEVIQLSLPPESYVARHRVFYRTPLLGKERPLRVAIDRDSIDLSCIAELEFAGQAVEFVPVPYVLTHRRLVDGHIDAAVWSSDDMHGYISQQHGQIFDQPLSESTINQIGLSDTSAALVVPVWRTSVHAVIRNVLRPEKIVEIQQKVLNGEIDPEY